MTGTLKSQDEFYLGLHAQLIRRDPLELSSLVKASALDRDIQTLRSRVMFEGLSFLTKTLPLLGKAFDQGLVSGRFTIPLGFRAQKNRCRPLFLQAYINLVFAEDGCLLEEIPVGVIKHVRQVLFFAYKLEVPSSESQNEEVISRFVETDDGLGLSCDGPLAEQTLRLAKIVTRKVFHDFDHKDIHPRHGPGAVATGEKLEEKWEFSRLFNTIHQVYPYYEYFVVGGSHELSDRLDWYKSLRRLESGCAKVVLVPKDSRGPRLISCEPLEYQWIQQGLGRKLSEHLEYHSWYTRGNVNFTRQDINRNFAKTSSASQRFATLDLKDASDRVSLELVRRVFETTPGLLRALEACRTTQTRLPNGDVMDLWKFAPMGSALCFPIEAYIFWCIIVCTIVVRTNLPLARVAKQVYVYGDDIVVPTHWALFSIQGLESVGLVVNMDKSCITGFFRESCGMDAYKGEDVTPSRLRKLWTSHVSDGSAYVSYIALANSLTSKGYKNVSDSIWTELERVYGVTPYGTSRSSFPCRIVDQASIAISLNRKSFRSRVNRNYQRIEFLLPSLSSRRMRSKLDGWHRLLRNVVAPPVGDPSVVVFPRSTKLKRGWMSVG